MRKFLLLLAAGAVLSGCGQSADNSSANEAGAASAAAEKPRPAYCFFTDDHTKDWKVSVDKSGSVVVHGKGYAEDARYKAVLGAPTVSGEVAEIAPTLAPNDTGYASRDNWWDMEATIPGSAAVTTVNVKCGEKTLASLKVVRKG